MASVKKLSGYIINPNGDEFDDIDLEYLIETYTDGWGILNQENKTLDITDEEFENSAFNSSDKNASRVACNELFQNPLHEYKSGDVQVFEFTIDEEGNTAMDLQTTIQFYNAATQALPDTTATILLPSCIKTSIWGRDELIAWRDLVNKLLEEEYGEQEGKE